MTSARPASTSSAASDSVSMVLIVATRKNFRAAISPVVPSFVATTTPRRSKSRTVSRGDGLCFARLPTRGGAAAARETEEESQKRDRRAHGTGQAKRGYAPCQDRGYSYRSESTGSSCAAFTAG